VQNTAFSTNKTLNVNGRIVDLTTPVIMAILNVTPDSFYDGGKNCDEKSILRRAEEAVTNGAMFIDIGGYSSRPGAENISEQEELNRILPALRLIAPRFPELLISVDTFRSQVARAAVEHGAAIINDISGGTLDTGMFDTVASLKVPYILMHMKGNPQTMMKEAQYENVVKELLNFFQKKVYDLALVGINDVIIDPGFGFAKTREHNFDILSKLDLLRMVGKPVMAGLSRKSLVWKTLDIQPADALNGTTVLNTVALLKGASILRVHDVKEAREAIILTEAMRSTEAGPIINVGGKR
jgi:dihydropteroate synthase